MCQDVDQQPTASLAVIMGTLGHVACHVHSALNPLQRNMTDVTATKDGTVHKGC